MQDLIKTLVEAWGPSGYEHHVRELIRTAAAPYADKMRVDALGNLICRMGKKKGEGAVILVAAHMDEIGLIVSHIDRQGFLHFQNIGGLLHNHLHGNRVKFEDGTLGVVAVHEPFGAGRQKLPDYSHFYIDVGEAQIPVGSPAAFWREYQTQGERLTAKSMDDRISCAVALETMRRLKEAGYKEPNEIYFVFTVQEEVGLRGATTAGFGVDPDFAIALDVTATGDVPKAEGMAVALGKGTAIKLMDARQIVAPPVRDFLISVAEAQGIPYQREVLALGTTDGAAIQLARGGVPTGVISIPCRHIHTTSETVDMRDVLASVDLLTATLAADVSATRPV